VLSRASYQTGTLSFIAIDFELFTFLCACLFVIVTMEDGQASNKTKSLASRLWGGEDWALTLFAAKGLC
jgi:hypothetical protein